ncbi:hypothetical protein Cni_G19336 [Canna indica]|uniref:Subtilisin-like protease fibronectin type-III domain-containing protein n=1 Tax=Canna indica TaxID=4628 RepID=A0AAQ3KRD6_9LILI|nr:hypothetical protein Cni_G19336 [Canna indica]
MDIEWRGKVLLQHHLWHIDGDSSSKRHCCAYQKCRRSKSAIMTTSDDKDRDGKAIQDGTGNTTASFFAMGIVHFNPSKATDPGLVYDMPIDDYITYICTKFGHADAIVHDRYVDCSKVKKISESELNYSSIMLKSGSTINRMVTNVGQASSSYEVKVDVPASMEVTVTPTTLVFT